MKAEPKRLFLHIGLHKTGTTYLQQVMGANRESLLAAGIHCPGGAGEPMVPRATRDLLGGRPRGYNDPRINGSWEELVRVVHDSGSPTVLLSDEGLGGCKPQHVRRIVQDFDDREVHVVITVRDLGRVVVSEWQEEIKNDRSWTWREFIEAVREGDRSVGKGRGFWRRQDLVHRCEVWLHGIPANHIHVVTVPKPGAARDELVTRFSAVVDIDPVMLTDKPEWSNETVGVAGTEVIRRVNERLGGRLNEPAYNRAVKVTLVPQLARRTAPVRFTLPVEEVSWLGARADAMIAWIKASGVHVSGDLEDLRVHGATGRRPDEVSVDELLDVALDGLALMTEQYATSYWSRRRHVIEVQHEANRTWVKRAQGAIYESKRKVLQMTFRNTAAERSVRTMKRFFGRQA